MARKKYEKVVIEDIELKPQVIGYTYKKKSNIGRVIFIFIAFALVVYYINDISIFINDILGKNSADSIKNLSGSNNKNDKENDNNIEKVDVVFYVYDNGLSFIEGSMNLNNFNFINNKLSFDISNDTEKSIDLKNENYFLELYTENKTLLERIKVDINVINEKSKVSFAFNTNNTFYYLTFVKKSVNDYPIVTLNNDETGLGKIKCVKDIEEIVYSFRNDKLESIKNVISDSNITGEDYYTNYIAYQNKIANYNNITGITATFNGTLNGYTAVIDVNLSQIDLDKLNEKYYYSLNEEPKVVKFEMETYGFTCE